MKIEVVKYNNIRIEKCRFGNINEVEEHHVIFHVIQINKRFDQQLRDIRNALDGYLITADRNIRPVFKRYFLSDAENQLPEVLESEKSQSPCAVSIVQQPPLDGTKITLWVYMKSDVEAESSESFFIEKKNGYSHIWMTGKYLLKGNAFRQTEQLFNQYAAGLKQVGCCLKDNCIRTWLFVPNIGLNYGDVVSARKDFFATQDLTEYTHYIASTGIEGTVNHPEARVVLDAYAVGGLQKRQQRYLHAPSHFCPTHQYGVTFERGTVVDYGDRSHIFISGTASINNKGEIVYQGDVENQTCRMLENIDALLAEADAGFENVACMVVYLRDIADYQAVNTILEKRMGTIPKVIVWAPVCRSGWLVEAECIAIKRNNNPTYANL